MATELLLTKIFEITPKEGLDEDKYRDWLPVTSLGVNDRRVTVRLPYPRGDFDKNYVKDDDGNYHLDCPAGSECDKCNGTGKVNGAECPVCHGVGSTKVEAGAITVAEDGTISLRIEDASIGITSDGRLYARSKIVENGGLAVDDNDKIYVTVDDTTLGINDDGQLYVKETPRYAPPTQRLSGNIGTSGTAIITITEPFVVPDNVNKVQVYVALDLIPSDYQSSVSMSLFTIDVGGVKSDVYTWDQTIPYTIINYTATVDTTTKKTLANIELAIDPHDSEPFHGGSYKCSVTVMQV